jgi:hypothetical protein
VVPTTPDFAEWILAVTPAAERSAGCGKQKPEAAGGPQVGELYDDARVAPSGRRVDGGMGDVGEPIAAADDWCGRHQARALALPIFAEAVTPAVTP